MYQYLFFVFSRYLKATLDRHQVKPQDLKIALGVVASNPEGHLLAWRHLKAHWTYMQAMLGNGTFSLGSLISAVTSHFATPYDHLEVNITLLFSYFFCGLGQSEYLLIRLNIFALTLGATFIITIPRVHFGDL